LPDAPHRFRGGERAGSYSGAGTAAFIGWWAFARSCPRRSAGVCERTGCFGCTVPKGGAANPGRTDKTVRFGGDVMMFAKSKLTTSRGSHA
jgi:hypothetical protein